MFAPESAQPTRRVRQVEPKPETAVRNRLFRKLLRFGRQETAPLAGRWWLLTGTDSSGAPIQVEISEELMRRSQGRLVIGRDETHSNITIADHTVSRRHAVLWLDERGLLIEDTDSRNGTWVDGRHVTPSLGAVRVGSSTRITLGGVKLNLVIAG
jgi:hypothetical protein